MKKPWFWWAAGLCLACQVAADAPASPVACGPHAVPDAYTPAMQGFVASFVPAGHHEVLRRCVSVDGESAELIRWQAQTPLALGGEHVSLLWSPQGHLQGFADMRLPDADAPLPGEDEARAAADAFLRAHAPDLLGKRELHWIRPHDETVLKGGQPHKLRGMKVKMRNRSDGRWFWVIVGAQGRPIVFERDIVWLNFPGKRQTEKWLHDDWLAQRGRP